ncbi:hypothetical protein F5Y19DRAFT_483204 [Xylariaceae sp. FL1651]|nr:hypothetical protein F5Y19DRAFT_483204 [Xylariaceae sp. FL1651]
MNISSRNPHHGRSASNDHKRPREHDDAEERRVRRRSDDGDAAAVRGVRGGMRSPRRQLEGDHRDYRRAGDMDRERKRHGDKYRDRDQGDVWSPNDHLRRRTHSRSRSPYSRHHHKPHHDPTHPSSQHHHRHQSRRASTTSRRDLSPPILPFNARALSRSADFHIFQPLFARYLEVQKQIDIATLDEREVRGRWKSFVAKWNNAELVEGWYRPETFEDIMLNQQGTGRDQEGKERQDDRRRPTLRDRGSSQGPKGDAYAFQREDSNALSREAEDVGFLPSQDAEENEDEDDDDDDGYGPALPTQNHPHHSLEPGNAKPPPPSQSRQGPGIPTLSDLTLRRELEAADREDARAALRHDRKADRALQKERLNELAPRADPGSAARRLEKRREARDANAAFASAKTNATGGDVPELGDAELLGEDGGGAGGGGIEEYKRLKREAERRRSEREVRREEVARAKREEREERLREYREREASTVDMLREIARSRFG